MLLLEKKVLTKKIMLFSGDSLLRNIFTAMCSFSWSSQIDCTGIMHQSKTYYTPHSQTVHFQWAPSAYFQQPTHYIPDHHCAVMHMGVWDMGKYYRGESQWKIQMEKNMIRWTRAARKHKTRLFWLRLHKLYRDNTKCRRNLKCYRQNTQNKETAFRQISDQLANHYGLIIIDTFNITSTPHAEIDCEDGVHYRKKTTLLEASIMDAVLRKHKCFK